MFKKQRRHTIIYLFIVFWNSEKYFFLINFNKRVYEIYTIKKTEDSYFEFI